MFINGDTMKPKHKVKITAKHEKSGKIIECYKHDLAHPHMIGFKETKEIVNNKPKAEKKVEKPKPKPKPKAKKKPAKKKK